LTSRQSLSLATKWPGRLVQWQAAHGRNDLPWQNTRDPYRVWLSEIMLQQTQVVTVMGYFARFLVRFPDVRALAAARLDDVLALWSGLGYYSRARNLHRCAVDVVQVHGGEFPRTSALLQTLPGIGPSTAAAVASLCFGERVAILDGNVKRVLTRLLGFDGDLAIAAQERLLWGHATALLPKENLYATMPRYTQGVMDLGATLCLPKKPRCEACPVQDLCVAREQGRPETYPVKTKKLKRSAQSLWLLWATSSRGAVCLTQRPTPGVWAGLYCFPLFDDRDALLAHVPASFHAALQDQPAFVHVLTHKDLHLHVVQLAVPEARLALLDAVWLGMDACLALGLPAPIRKLLQAVGQPNDVTG
jgi:A/G-specific adenine glycosylase